MPVNYQHIFEQIANVAAPYVIYWQADTKSDGITIELNDEDRGRPEKSTQIFVRGETIASTSDVGGLFTRAVMRIKKKLQTELAKECTEPEIRLWIAENRDTDLMDNKPIPSILRKRYEDSKKKVVLHTNEKKEEPVPVRTSRGVPVRDQKRKPRCPVHEVEMVYLPDRGKWKCPESGCRIVGRPPKEDSPVSSVTVGKGKLDLRVIYPEDGGEPSVIVIAENNVALDVTALIDMEKFREWNDYESAAARAKSAGESTTSLPKTYSTLLLKFPKPLRVFGCEHS